MPSPFNPNATNFQWKHRPGPWENFRCDTDGWQTVQTIVGGGLDWEILQMSEWGMLNSDPVLTAEGW